MSNVHGRSEAQETPMGSTLDRHRPSPNEPPTATASGDGQQQAQQQADEAKQQGRQAQAEAAGAAEEMKQQAQQAADEAKQAAQEAGDQMRSSAERAAGQAREQVSSAAMQQKEWVGEELQHFGDALRSAATRLHETEDERVARYAEMAADQVDSTAGYLRQRDIRGLVDDCDGFARRRPEVFLGGMFLAGLGISRFLKSSRRQNASEAFNVDDT